MYPHAWNGNFTLSLWSHYPIATSSSMASGQPLSDDSMHDKPAGIRMTISTVGPESCHLSTFKNIWIIST